VRVAAYADLRKVHQCYVAAMTVDGIAPESRHRESDTPVVLGRARGRLLGDIVAVVDDDRNLRELLEIGERHRHTFQRAIRTRHWCRHLAFGKDEAAAGFICHDPADVRVFHRGDPARAAALRVRHEDSGANLFK
jgi:hypothetical protein